MRWSHVARLLLTCGAIAGLCACVSFTPEDLKPEARRAAIAAAAPAEVVAVATNNAPEFLYVNGQSKEVDLDGFSKVLATLVADSLRASGVGIEVGGRPISLQVAWLDFMFQGPCIVDYNVVLGENEPFGQQSKGRGGNLEKACRLAFEAASDQILRDVRTVRYLEEK